MSKLFFITVDCCYDIPAFEISTKREMRAQITRRSILDSHCQTLNEGFFKEIEMWGKIENYVSIH